MPRIQALDPTQSSGQVKTLFDMLGKNPAKTVFVIDEVEMDNWGMGGRKTLLRHSPGLNTLSTPSLAFER